MFGEYFRSKLAKRRNIIDNPHPSAMSGKHKIGGARMNGHVAHGNGWKIVAFVLSPVAPPSTEIHNPNSVPKEKQELEETRIFLDDVSEAANP